MLRQGDATVRPGSTHAFPDFTRANDGKLVIEDDDDVRDLDVYVMAGDDTDPPASHSYEASLYTMRDRLLVRVVKRCDSSGRLLRTNPEHTELRSSDDGGRTWQTISQAPTLEGWELVDRVEAH
jgi:hypothetical protein